jgi:methionine synthase II (cobalamin-independent)
MFCNTQQVLIQAVCRTWPAVVDLIRAEICALI